MRAGIDSVLPKLAVGQLWQSANADLRRTSRLIVKIINAWGTMLIAFRRWDASNLEYAWRERFLRWAQRAEARVVSQQDKK